MPEEQSCIVCFYPLNKKEKTYTCIKKECDVKTCSECINSLIEFSENNDTIPSCPGENCNAIFTLSDINDIPKAYLRLYASACFKHMMKSDGNVAKKRIQEAKILSDLRNERLKYLENEYPKAISLVAKITFKNKLRVLDKQKSKIAAAQLSKLTRICMNLTCNGFLDANFVCMTCDTEFCNKCEKRLLKAGHICKQEDLDSVNLVNNMVKCPGCKLPVFKNVGCDSITCSNCSTRFIYSTGEIGGHGSSNAKLQKKILIQKKERLSHVLKDKVNEKCIELLLIAEALEPRVKMKSALLTPLRDYFKNGNAKLAGRRLAFKIDEYYNYLFRNKRYYKFMTNFEKDVYNMTNANIPSKQKYEILVKKLENIINDFNE
jgi:hypothetical protein